SDLLMDQNLEVIFYQFNIVISITLVGASQCIVISPCFKILLQIIINEKNTLPIVYGCAIKLRFAVHRCWRRVNGNGWRFRYMLRIFVLFKNCKPSHLFCVMLQQNKEEREKDGKRFR